MESLVSRYHPPEGIYDEMFDGREIRSSYQISQELLAEMPDAEFVERAEYVRSSYLDQGITFDVGGVERPFPLDVVPRVITAADWAQIEAGVQQRVRALEAFLADVYGPGKVFSDGVLPRRLVATSTHYHRVAHGIRPSNGVRIHVSGTDLVRDASGIFRVLEDNVRIPSGVSYVMTNRRAMSAAFPEWMGRYQVRPVHGYPQLLLDALRAAAPEGVSEPNVVVLTPGVHNSAYFEHALLARMMGVELVEGSDLFCEGGQVKARTTTGAQPVHVIYRRVDDDFLDPLYFRPDSVLGVAGVVAVAAAGGVTIANAVGNGVADDKLICTYVPDLIRYYLGAEPILAGVDTWRLENPDDRIEVLDRLEEMVVKPVDGSGGKGVVICPAAGPEELARLRAAILDEPRNWIAQPVVQLSTVPTVIKGQLSPRHVDLRPFAVNNGESVQVLPGGLTRVALGEGQLIVNSSQGGGSKDTWVLMDEGAGGPPRAQFWGSAQFLDEVEPSGLASAQTQTQEA